MTVTFGTPSSFSARDEFDQTAGALAGKTLPIGGTWQGSGDADDFTVETGFHRARRTATLDGVADTLGRFERPSSPTLAAVCVRATVRTSVLPPQAGDTCLGVLARYIDVSNWLRLGVHPSSVSLPGATQILVEKYVEGVRTTIGRWGEITMVAGVPLSLSLVADAGGRWWAWVFRRTAGLGRR